jgi:hypothetical protein
MLVTLYVYSRIAMEKAASGAMIVRGVKTPTYFLRVGLGFMEVWDWGGVEAGRVIVAVYASELSGEGALISWSIDVMQLEGVEAVPSSESRARRDKAEQGVENGGL